jgi:hypothetical protein
MLKQIWLWGFVVSALTSVSGQAPHSVKWENYISKHYTFTLMKPAGWNVEEAFQAEPTIWAFSAMPPDGHSRVSMVHGSNAAARGPLALAQQIVADLRKRFPTLQLASTMRTQEVGKKTIYLFEGTYSDERSRKWQFSDLVTAGDGMLMNQRIEALDGQLKQAAPILLQTLANLRVAKNVFSFDEGGRAGQPQTAPVALTPRRLAGGWGGYAAPADWQQADLGKGQVIACDPAQQVFFVVASADFVTPKYNLVRVPGILVSDFLKPHQAMAFACIQQGHGRDFRFDVKEREDLVQKMRAGVTGGRPCSVADFSYTFDRKGEAYKGVSLGYSVGNYMDSTWVFGHMTVWAPAARFDALAPMLGQIAASYQLNGEKVGEYIADGIRRYQAGIAALGRTIARNSEQMRRENYELFMERGRVQEYTSYLTTRMIMGEWDYLAGAYGYVRGDASGLYTADGNRISAEPYGGAITRGMQEVNSRPLYEAIR